MVSKSIICSEVLHFSGERMLQYLVWEYMEQKGFDVYGEVWLGHGYGRIDLVCIKDELVGGLEVKRKKDIENRDISEVKGYVRSGFFSDIALLIQYKGPNTNDISDMGTSIIFRQDFEDLEYMPAFLYVPIKESNTPPFYELDPSIPQFLRNLPVFEDSVTIFPSHLFEFEFKNVVTPTKELKLTRDNEITIEYNLWKEYRRKGACVLPQVNITGILTHNMGAKKGNKMEIDLLIIDEDSFTAIEVKDKSQIGDEQIESYKFLKESGTINEVLFVVPKNRTKQAHNKLLEKGASDIPVLAYEDILGRSVTNKNQKSLTEF